MTEAIAENKQQLAERVEEIRSNRDLSDSAKQRMIGEAYDEAAERHGELVAERAEAAAREVVQRERAVFGLAYPKDAVTNRDKEAYRTSYRDAAFRVFNMEPENLERVLERAERIGDEQLAQAVYHEAVERGISGVAKRYRDARPNAQQRWEKYVSARQAGESTEGLLFSGYSSVGPERPPEVGGMGGNAA
jgi:hypothetical protein